MNLVWWSLAALVLHEVAHAAAAKVLGMRIVGLHIGVGRVVARWRWLHVRPIPLGVAVEIPDDDLLVARPLARGILHLIGPLANVLVAWLLIPIDPLGAAANLLVGLSNALPLPFLDGGWVLSLLLLRNRYAEEFRWHAALARPVWGLIMSVFLITLL